MDSAWLKPAPTNPFQTRLDTFGVDYSHLKPIVHRTGFKKKKTNAYYSMLDFFSQFKTLQRVNVSV